MVSLSRKLPLGLGKYGARKDEARARLESTRYEMTDAESGLRARTEKTLASYRDANAKTELYAGRLLPMADESLAVTLKEYEGGKADFLHVLEAQRLLLDLKLEMEEALVMREISVAELEMLAGREFRPVEEGGIR